MFCLRSSRPVIYLLTLSSYLLTASVVEGRGNLKGSTRSLQTDGSSEYYCSTSYGPPPVYVPECDGKDPSVDESCHDSEESCEGCRNGHWCSNIAPTLSPTTTRPPSTPTSAMCLTSDQDCTGAFDKCCNGLTCFLTNNHYQCKYIEKNYPTQSPINDSPPTPIPTKTPTSAPTPIPTKTPTSAPTKSPINDSHPTSIPTKTPTSVLFLVRGIEYDSQMGTKKVDRKRSVGHFDDNDYVTYNSLNFGVTAITKSILLSYSKGNVNRGHKMELRIGGHDGDIIGEFSPSNTGSWFSYATARIEISDVTGINDLTLVGKGGSGILNIDYFELSSSM